MIGGQGKREETGRQLGFREEAGTAYETEPGTPKLLPVPAFRLLLRQASQYVFSMSGDSLLSQTFLQ